MGKDDKSENIQKEMMSTHFADQDAAEKQKERCIQKADHAKKKILHSERKIRAYEHSLKEIVKKEGRVSVEHLLQANNAMQSLGQMGVKAQGVQRCSENIWLQQLSEIPTQCKMILEAKRLSTQEACLAVLKR